jgi:hypothetical protein
VAQISDGDLAEVRRWVGSKPGDAEIDERFRRLSSASAVALEILRQRLADMIADPLVYRVEGDASWSYEHNISHLCSQISQLEVASDVPLTGGMTVGRLVRAGAAR